VWAVTLLGETLTPPQLIGGFTIVFGVALMRFVKHSHAVTTLVAASRISDETNKGASP
jgi:hypothetical protein